MRILIASLILAILIVVSASTAEYYVDTEFGNDEWSGENWQQAKATISATLLVAGSGDRLHVAEGTYPEIFSMLENLQLLGGYPAGGGSRDPTQFTTVIAGQGSGPVILAAEGALLDGVTITEGRAPKGAGMLHESVTMTVQNCSFLNNTATGTNPDGGGAMFFFMSSSRIINCSFINNETRVANPGIHEIMGGALFMWSATPRFENCRFEGNTVLNNSLNNLRLGGAGWFVASQPEFRCCRFTGNSAQYGGGCGWWNRSLPFFERCNFEENEADNGGGIAGLFNESSIPDAPVVIRHCVFEGNRAVLDGGGLLMARHGWFTLTNCLIIRNRAEQNGGGCLIDDHTLVRMHHVTVADNNPGSSGQYGAGIAVLGSSSLFLRAGIIYDNHGAGGGIYGQDNCRVGVVTTVDFANSNGSYTGSIIEPCGALGNRSLDPKFISIANHEYLLSEPETGDPQQLAIGRSPCIDSHYLNVTSSGADCRTTRSDGEPDIAWADGGYHYPVEAPFLEWHRPAPGAEEVPRDGIIQVDLLDEQGNLVSDSLSMTVNGITVTPEVENIPLGIRIIWIPTETLAPCREIKIQIAAVDDTGNPIINPVYRFTTAGCPPTTPTPGMPELTLEMNAQQYQGGDHLQMWLTSEGQGDEDWLIDRWLALEVYSEFFFQPAWDRNVFGWPLWLPDDWYFTETVLDFYLPSPLATGGPFYFWLLYTDPGTYDMISGITGIDFSFR